MFLRFGSVSETAGGEALVVAKGRFPSPAPLPSGPARNRTFWARNRTFWSCYVTDRAMDSAFV